ARGSHRDGIRRRVLGRLGRRAVLLVCGRRRRLLAGGTGACRPRAPHRGGPQRGSRLMPPLPRLPPDPWGKSAKASTRELVSMLVGDRRGTIALLALCSVLAGVAEAAFLAVLVSIALALVSHPKTGAQHSNLFHIHASTSTLVIIAAVLVIARTALLAPLAILPARIASHVQARLRNELFSSFTSAFSFLVLLAAAFALNAEAAIIVLISAGVLFRVLRPLNQAGVRRARALSDAQMNYAGGIAQANRLAEETRVFGVAEAQRAQVGQLIDVSRSAFYRMQ